MSSSVSTIPIVALGVYRHVAATIDPLFLSTPFRMAAILDLKSQPAAFQYSPLNLGTVLHTLHPSPKIFITGAAISAEMTRESVSVWEAYVKESGSERHLLINVSFFFLAIPLRNEKGTTDNAEGEGLWCGKLMKR